MSWILIEELATKKVGKPIYFKAMVAIGPCGTDKLDEAAKFDSKQGAMMSPAYVHPLSCYEPLEVEETA